MNNLSANALEYGITENKYRIEITGLARIATCKTLAQLVCIFEIFYNFIFKFVYDFDSKADWS